MIIIGVDPGVARTGWAAVRVCGGSGPEKIEAIEYGCIETSLELSSENRFLEIADSMDFIIKKHKAETLAIEEIFFLKKSKTLFSIAQARGVILYIAAKNKMKIFQYNPRIIKITLTGYGSSEKNQMQHMVKNILGLKDIPKPDDTADALAVAVCHYFNSVRFS